MDCRFREGHLKRVVGFHIPKPSTSNNATGIIVCVRRHLTQDIIARCDLDNLRCVADRPLGLTVHIDGHGAAAT